MQIAAQSTGIDELLTSFFGFLNRKTDFYVEIPAKTTSTMGFPEGIAERKVLDAFKRYPFRAPNSGSAVSTPEIAGSSTSKSAAVKASTTSSTQQTTYPVKPNKSDPAHSQPRLTPEGKQYPIGNGGYADNYYWTQTLKDVTVYVDIPSDISNSSGSTSNNEANSIRVNNSSTNPPHVWQAVKKKDITCKITSSKLHLAVLGNVLIDGTLEGTVIVDDCLWTLSSAPRVIDSNNTAGSDVSTAIPSVVMQQQILITLDKCKHTWWKHVIIGHPEIDTSKVMCCDL